MVLYEQELRTAVQDRDLGDEQDLRVFWGADYGRLEYLAHLVASGRVKADGPLDRSMSDGRGVGDRGVPGVADPDLRGADDDAEGLAADAGVGGR
jgi:hypothetical protein